MKKSIFFVSLLLFLGHSLGLSAQENRHKRPRFNPTNPSVHDPVMIRQDSVYYLFSTGVGVSVLSSTDMKTWKREPSVFAQAPQWAVELIPGFRGHIWAPDVIWHEGRFHLFYSCSAFGKNTSAIGHASTPTLHPSDSLYGWTDHGMIVQSVPGRDFWNAIDANVIIDEEQVPWMNFGSFWDGIKMVKLTPDMGCVAKPEVWRTLARKKTPESSLKGDNAIEAPFIFKKGDYYYLFVSHDYCCRGKESTYKIVVGRSKHVSGPYIDHEGVRMEHGGGTLVAAGNEQYAGVGHCAAYTFDGVDYLVAHGYSLPDGGNSKLVIRRIEWDEEGWPVVVL